MGLFYTLLIRLYGIFLHIAAGFDPKARAWVGGRRNGLQDLEVSMAQSRDYAWIHCASAGEFEQALPLLSSLRKADRNLKFAVSFFSPSGYELCKDTGLADLFFYLPLDTPGNAENLVRILQPRFAVFIRKEIWWNLLKALNRQCIPTYLVNAATEQKENFLYRIYLDRVSALFTQVFDTKTYGNLKLEKVIHNKNSPFRDETLEIFCKDALVLIAGSCWETEENILAAFYKKHSGDLPQLKIILAPHELNAEKLSRLENLFGSKILPYSKGNIPAVEERILLLDTNGILKYAYRYAALAVLGGGFGKGVHNVAEAAVYGIPVLFGPNYRKFEELRELAKKQLVFPATTEADMEVLLLRFCKDAPSREALKTGLEQWFADQDTAAGKIAAVIIKNPAPG